MAADHDIRHAQRNHGIFDSRGNAARLRPERRHDIPGITNDKELSRLLLGNQFRHQTAVRTGDEQRFGILAGGQAAEEFFTLGKISFWKLRKPSMICCIAVSLLCSYYGMTKITVIQFTIDDKNGNRYSNSCAENARRQRLLLPV